MLRCDWFPSNNFLNDGLVTAQIRLKPCKRLTRVAVVVPVVIGSGSSCSSHWGSGLQRPFFLQVSVFRDLIHWFLAVRV